MRLPNPTPNKSETEQNVRKKQQMLVTNTSDSKRNQDIMQTIININRNIVATNRQYESNKWKMKFQWHTENS